MGIDVLFMKHPETCNSAEVYTISMIDDRSQRNCHMDITFIQIRGPLEACKNLWIRNLRRQSSNNASRRNQLDSTHEYIEDQPMITVFFGSGEMETYLHNHNFQHSLKIASLRVGTAPVGTSPVVPAMR